MTTKPQLVLEVLDRIEAEMKSIGYWAENPPDLRADYASGSRQNYLDAPTFELWLQCVFIPNARAAAHRNEFPATSSVGAMAVRQYDYHSVVEEAVQLARLLGEFDAIIENR